MLSKLPVARFLICALAAIRLAAGGLALADVYEDGRAAANRGEFATAFSLWKPLADSGDDRAQIAVGRMYARGDGLKRDLVVARQYFERAAEKGNPTAYLNLGKIYYFGDGTPQDLDRSYLYFAKASAGGLAEAEPFLSKMKGRAVPTGLPEPTKIGAVIPPTPVVLPPTPNIVPEPPVETPPPGTTPGGLTEFVMEDTPTPAVPTPTAVPADPLAPYRSSVASRSNLGSDRRSFRFDPVAEAIIRSFPGGMNQLSIYAGSLFYGPLVTDEAALANHLAQAGSGNQESQNIMGFAALYAGNPDLARSWFEKSAQQGNGTALFALGNFAFENNYERASQLYQEAGTKGVVAAKRNLGYFLLRGIGVDQNKERGRIYLTEASKLGDNLATDLMK